MKKDVIWGLLDQALQSLLNLAIGATLIHFASKLEYGFYGIGFATQLLLTGFSNALVSTPMTVLAPSKDEKVQEDFCCGLIIGFFRLLIPIGILYSLLIYAFDAWHTLSDFADLSYAIAFSSPCIIFIEIMRRYLYIKQDQKSVFNMDILYSVIYISSLATVLYFTRTNLHIYALILSGIASLIASFVFFMRSEMIFARGHAIASSSLKEVWKDGKWALGGVLISWGQNQGYVYILALMKSSAVVAEANAARLFLAPINVISLGFSKVVMPKIVKLRVDNRIDDALKLARQVLMIMVAVILAYSVFIVLVKDWIIENFIDKDYLYLDALIISWCIYFLCQAFRNNNSILMQAFRYFKEITTSSAWTSALVLTLSLIVAKYYDINHVVLVMSFGELLLAIILWKKLNKKLASPNSDISVANNLYPIANPLKTIKLHGLARLFYGCTAITFIQIVFIILLIQWGGIFFSTPQSTPNKSDLIVVLGGGTGERLKKGLELYRAGYAPKLLLTGMPEMEENILPTYSVWRKKYLMEQNVPEHSILVDNRARTSLEEARIIQELMETQHWRNVIVVSDPPHLRRLSLIYSDVFLPEQNKTVLLVASNPTWWNPEHWWHNTSAAQFVLLELFKTFNFYACRIFGQPHSGTPLITQPGNTVIN